MKSIITLNEAIAFNRKASVFYFTLVRTASSPLLLFLGGELVCGETTWSRDDRIHLNLSKTS